MKELSIEEKAKRYDEAIRESSKIINHCAGGANIPECVSVKATIEQIFPELKESEDERIRKEIIAFLTYYHTGQGNSVKYNDGWIAWLEKQGQTFTKKDVDDAYLKGVCDAKQELEKQGEQKPADKPKFKVKCAGSEYNVFEIKELAGITFYGIEDKPNHIDYIKAENCEIISGYGVKENGSPYPTKPAVFSEQNPAWSEEDEYTLGETIQHLEELIRIDKAKHCACDVQYYQRDIDWLKSLKDRVVPQPKQEWKPSDEQMITLRHVISGCSYDIEPLAEMEEQLKKLRGGNKYETTINVTK